jgi:hypothetical protein
MEHGEVGRHGDNRGPLLPHSIAEEMRNKTVRIIFGRERCTLASNNSPK